MKAKVTMTEEQKHQVLSFEPLLRNLNRSYTREQLVPMFKLYNEVAAEKKTDSGCGSCRRVVVSFLRQLLDQIQAENNQS